MGRHGASAFMVLKRTTGFAILLILAAECSAGWAYDSTAFKQALKLHQKNKDDQALHKLEAAYDFSKKDLPPEVPALAAGAAASLKSWGKVERIAEAALLAHDPKWPADSANSDDLAKYLKTQTKPVLRLVRLAAEAKSRIFVSSSEDVSDEDREKKKDQIKLYSDALAQIGFEADSVQESVSRVEEHEKLDAMESYKFSLFLTASYWTWEDRPVLALATSAHAVLYTPCVGLGLHYTNEFYQWSGGACWGSGAGALQFSDNHFDDHASVTLISGFGSVLMQLSDSGAAFGIEGDAMSVTVGGTNSAGTQVSGNNTEFAFLAVGRFRLGSLDVKLKGGTIISDPSALWEVELSYPFWEFR